MLEEALGLLRRTGQICSVAPVSWTIKWTGKAFAEERMDTAAVAAAVEVEAVAADKEAPVEEVEAAAVADEVALEAGWAAGKAEIRLAEPPVLTAGVSTPSSHLLVHFVLLEVRIPFASWIPPAVPSVLPSSVPAAVEAGRRCPLVVSSWT